VQFHVEAEPAAEHLFLVVDLGATVRAAYCFAVLEAISRYLLRSDQAWHRRQNVRNENHYFFHLCKMIIKQTQVKFHFALIGRKSEADGRG